MKQENIGIDLYYRRLIGQNSISVKDNDAKQAADIWKTTVARIIGK